MKVFKIVSVCMILATCLCVYAELQSANPGIELLVYDKDHWMDGLTAEERKARGITDKEFDGRYQKGDVIEVRPLGFWTDSTRDFDRNAFRVISVPAMSSATAKMLLSSSDSKKRQYKVSVLSTKKEVSMENVTIINKSIL